MKSYILTHENIPGEVEVCYDQRNFLYRISINAEVEVDDLNWIYAHLPVVPEYLKGYRNQNWTVVEVPVDLSFEAWWKLWPEVKDNKANAKKFWENNRKMSDADRARAIACMAAYTRWVRKFPTKHPKWPDSWLSERRWEINYSKLLQAA
jgi:hypothetical protein